MTITWIFFLAKNIEQNELYPEKTNEKYVLNENSKFSSFWYHLDSVH